MQDIEVGKAVRPQLALRVSDVNAAWKKVSIRDMFPRGLYVESYNRILFV